jgi:tetratricopeptide (TPR) repeat protein
VLTAANREGAADELKKAKREKTRKRLLKRSVRKERRESSAPLFSTAPDSIPIEVFDEAEEIVHGASEGDIRAVLSKLPDAARDGISRIQLSLGKASQEKVLRSRPDEEHICDPITGRAGAKLFRGVYCGWFLGTFMPTSGLISVYAFVVDTAQAPLPPAALNIYLKLHALKTFVHEVAHHHDQTCRVRRGRWLADRKENVENYAERMEYRWTREIVVPYLEKTYQAETETLLAWIEHHGGLRVPLVFLAGDPRRTERNGLIRLAFSTSAAFEDWLDVFPSLSEVTASRIAFAQEIHYSDAYEECLTILNTVLATEPECLEALILKADTLIHLERFDEAKHIAEGLLNKNPNLEAALEIRGDFFEAREQWPQLLENSERFLECAGAESKFRKYALMHRAVALCALKRDEELNATMVELLQYRVGKNPFLKKRIFRRAGRELK